MRSFSFLLTLVLTITFAGGATRAAEQPAACRHAGAIVLFADAALKARASLGVFPRRRHGADELHLLIHYGGLKPAEIRRGLEALLRDRVRQANELAMAWAFGAGDRSDRDWLASVTTIDPRQGFSSLRAILTFDDGRTLFRLLSAPQTAPEPYERISLSFMSGHIAARWPLERKRAFAERAAAAGFPGLGAAVLFTDPDRSAFEGFISEHGGHPDLKAFDVDFLFNALLTVPNDLGALPEAGGNVDQRKRFYPVLKMGYRMGEFDILSIVLNMTGKEAEIVRVSERMLAEVDAGDLDAVRDPASGWTAAYREMVDTLGRQVTDQTLGSFDMGGTRHYRGRARDMLDWAIATRAIRDHVNGSAAGVPARPALLQSSFDWESWVSAARTVRDGTQSVMVARPAEQARVLIEVLYAAGLYDQVYLVTLNTALKPVERVAIWRDIALRLDRQCAQVSVAPGQALVLGGFTTFGFVR